jgi:hypothetical protein
MSFSIVSSDPGIARLRIEGRLDEATTQILRVELAGLLRSRPTRVELSMPYPRSITGPTRDLLLSFLEVLRAQGGRLVLHGLDDSPVAVIGLREMEHLLTVSAETG